MDPKSRFIAALALSTTGFFHLGALPAHADNDATELELYKRCKSGTRWDCERFLNTFPASRYASDVVGSAADKMGGGGERHDGAGDRVVIY